MTTITHEVFGNDTDSEGGHSEDDVTAGKWHKIMKGKEKRLLKDDADWHDEHNGKYDFHLSALASHQKKVHLLQCEHYLNPKYIEERSSESAHLQLRAVATRVHASLKGLTKHPDHDHEEEEGPGHKLHETLRAASSAVIAHLAEPVLPAESPLNYAEDHLSTSDSGLATPVPESSEDEHEDSVIFCTGATVTLSPEEKKEKFHDLKRHGNMRACAAEVAMSLNIFMLHQGQEPGQIHPNLRTLEDVHNSLTPLHKQLLKRSHSKSKKQQWPTQRDDDDSDDDDDHSKRIPSKRSEVGDAPVPTSVSSRQAWQQQRSWKKPANLRSATMPTKVSKPTHQEEPLDKCTHQAMQQLRTTPSSRRNTPQDESRTAPDMKGQRQPSLREHTQITRPPSETQRQPSVCQPTPNTQMATQTPRGSSSTHRASALQATKARTVGEPRVASKQRHVESVRQSRSEPSQTVAKNAGAKLMAPPAAGTAETKQHAPAIKVTKAASLLDSTGSWRGTKQQVIPDVMVAEATDPREVEPAKDAASLAATTKTKLAWHSQAADGSPQGDQRASSTQETKEVAAAEARPESPSVLWSAGQAMSVIRTLTGEGDDDAASHEDGVDIDSISTELTSDETAKASRAERKRQRQSEKTWALYQKADLPFKSAVQVPVVSAPLCALLRRMSETHKAGKKKLQNLKEQDKIKKEAEARIKQAQERKKGEAEKLFGRVQVYKGTKTLPAHLH